MTEQTMNRLKRSKGHRLDGQCFGRDIGSKQELICKLLRNVWGQAMRVRPIVVLTGLVVLANAQRAGAEQLQVLNLEYQPMIEAASGRIDVCALHFAVAGLTTTQRALGVQGTVNTTYFADRVPAVLIKVVVIEAKNGEQIRHPIKSAVVYDNDAITTRDFKQTPSEDGKAFLAWNEFFNAEAAFTSLQEKMVLGGVWLSFNLGEKPLDYTMQFRTDQNWLHVLEDLHKCNLKGLEQIQHEVQ
jgi:hypothetical protein